MFDKLPPRVLIIESDKNISNSLSNSTEKIWFDFVKVDKLEKAIAFSNITPPDLIIIDSMLRDEPAIMVAIKIRGLDDLAQVPVIFVLNPDEAISDYTLANDKFVALLTKPFTSDQLMSLIRSLLRQSNLVLRDKVIRYKEVSMDLTTYEVLRKGKVVRLGPTEFKILQLLMQSPKLVFSRQNIINKVWGANKNISLRTVDVHINRIRLSLKNKESGEFIKTARSAGYCLDLQEDEL